MARRPRTNKVEERMTRVLDKLAIYEEYCKDVLPILQEAIRDGWTADKIEKHPRIQAMLVARQLTIALREQDTGKALAAIKDVRDRTGGKPIERKEIKHQLDQAPDEQLDAKLKTLLGDSVTDEPLPN